MIGRQEPITEARHTIFRDRPDLAFPRRQALGRPRSGKATPPAEPRCRQSRLVPGAIWAGKAAGKPAAVTRLKGWPVHRTVSEQRARPSREVIWHGLGARLALRGLTLEARR
jgi:hypothetical protein